MWDLGYLEVKVFQDTGLSATLGGGLVLSRRCLLSLKVYIFHPLSIYSIEAN